MKKLIPANIDEKNVTSDWIFDVIFINGDNTLFFTSTQRKQLYWFI